MGELPISTALNTSPVYRWSHEFLPASTIKRIQALAVRNRAGLGGVYFKASIALIAGT